MKLDNLKSNIRQAVRIPQLFVEWYFLKRAIHYKKVSHVKSILIATPDPNYLIGSKGDEAMIIGVVTAISDLYKNCNVGILTNLETLPKSLSTLKINIEQQWSNPWSLKALINIVLRYDGLIIVGADVMDGHYVPLSAARLWTLADVGASLGKQTAVLGFSFNQHPSLWLLPFLNKISSKLTIFARDAVSQDRFNSFSRAQAELVADAAFLLKPNTESDVVKKIAIWCETQRSQGKIVSGFNIHPMLLKNPSSQQLAEIIDCSVKALAGAMGKRPVSFVMISHDYRGPGMGDCEILAEITNRLQSLGFENVLYFNDQLHASELKALAGIMDIVITGRMHLSIAALGQGTPVAAITYQGKFHGLFQHFGLSDKYLISPEEIKYSDVFERWIISALDSQKDLKRQVAETLPSVKKLAYKNLSPFTGQHIL